MLNQNKIQVSFFLGLLGVVLLLSMLIMWPYFNLLVLASVLAITLYPLYNFILKLFKGKEALSSVVTVIVIVFVILIPAIFLSFSLFGEVKNLYSSLVSEQDGALKTMTTFLQGKLHLPVQDYTADISQYVSSILAWIGGNLSTLFSSVASIVINSVILILALFFLFINGKKIIKQLVAISPLSDEHDNLIVEKMGLAINSISRGYFTIALVQGFFVACGFAIFGVPNYFLWGAVSALAWLIPIVGVALVVVPALIYLLVFSSVWSVVGLAIWATVFNMLADNVLMPMLFKKGTAINPLLTILSILGGLSFFGPLGILVGPLVLSLLFSLIDVYPLIIKKN